ncbi:hypothetical protein BD413DRAFT_615519 [Trametes elegans]|nr:hypothetical protein BD413DRAFT_615519 [Trametes elegans]
MSTPPGLDASEVLIIYSGTFITSAFELSVPAFLLYEYLITLDVEIRLFWKRRFTTASGLFFYIRYGTLITYNILGCVSFASLSDNRYAHHAFAVVPMTDPGRFSCNILTKAQAAISILQYIPWAMFSALRVLALARMNWALAAIVFVFGCTPSIANYVIYGIGISGQNILTTGCQASTSLWVLKVIPELDLVVIAARVGVIISDLIVVLVTLSSTWRKGIRGRLGESMWSSLSNVIFYDGLIYFGVMLCFNILDLVLTIISIVTPWHPASYITIISDPLTAVLVCRFLLDLQAANQASMEIGSARSHAHDASRPGAVETLRFARVIGSVAATLDPDADQDAGSELNDEVRSDLDGSAVENVEKTSGGADGSGNVELASSGGNVAVEDMEVSCRNA